MQKRAEGSRGGWRHGQQLAGPGTWGAELQGRSWTSEGRGWGSELRPRRGTPVSRGTLPPWAPEPQGTLGHGCHGPPPSRRGNGVSPFLPLLQVSGPLCWMHSGEQGCEHPRVAATPPVPEPGGGTSAITGVASGPSPAVGGFLGLFGWRRTTHTLLSSSVGISRQASLPSSFPFW